MPYSAIVAVSRRVRPSGWLIGRFVALRDVANVENSSSPEK
jgi:hypothetical protein